MAHGNKKRPTPPQDFEALREYLIKNRQNLPKRLTQVAEYALRCPDEIAFGTTASIASETGVQPSTMVRLAHQLGFEGFSAFQNVFRERLRSRPISYDDRFITLESRIVDGSEEAVMLNGFLGAARESINTFEANVDLATLAAAVDVLAAADTIYLLAKRRAYPLIAHMAYAFGKLKINYHIVGAAIGNDNDLLATAGPGDAAITISFSPYAPETVAQVQMMANNKVPIVAITDSPFSPLATYSPIWFEIAEADYAGFRSLVASHVLSSTLPVAIAQQRRHRHKDDQG
ncbi:MAG: MurR/RpiR family transcriptional regulator [Desulfopila sp.]